MNNKLPFLHLKECARNFCDVSADISDLEQRVHRLNDELKAKRKSLQELSVVLGKNAPSTFILDGVQGRLVVIVTAGQEVSIHHETKNFMTIGESEDESKRG